jgi:hypothetical protein
VITAVIDPGCVKTPIRRSRMEQYSTGPIELRAVSRIRVSPIASQKIVLRAPGVLQFSHGQDPTPNREMRRSKDQTWCRISWSLTRNQA